MTPPSSPPPTFTRPGRPTLRRSSPLRPSAVSPSSPPLSPLSPATPTALRTFSQETLYEPEVGTPLSFDNCDKFDLIAAKGGVAAKEDKECHTDDEATPRASLDAGALGRNALGLALDRRVKFDINADTPRASPRLETPRLSIDTLCAPHLSYVNSAASLSSLASANSGIHNAEDVQPPPAKHEADPGPPPDGGRAAWLCVGSAFLLMFCMFGFVTSFGQLQHHYLAHQLSGYAPSTVAWIATAQSTLTFASSLFFGRIFDAHGARMLVVAGCSLSIVALVGLAFSTSFYQLLLAHALYGFATSVIWCPAAAVPGHWFARRRSTAIGIVGCGSGVGGVVYPLVLNKLLTTVSFRTAILVVAGCNAVLVLPAVFFVRTRLPPRAPRPWSALALPWKETRYTCLVLGTGLCMLNMFSPYFDAPVLAAANNFPASLAAYSVAILQAGSFFGRGTSGLLADAFGVWRVFGAMALACAGVLFAFWTAAPIPLPAAVIGLCAYGYASGAWITLVSAVVAAESRPEDAGMRIGMLWSAVSAPILAGPVVCGVLVGVDAGRFTYAGIFCGFTYLFGAIVACAPVAYGFVRKTQQKKSQIQVYEKSEKSEV